MSDLSLWPLSPTSPAAEMPLLAALMESSPDAWWIVGRDTSLMHFNSAFRRFCLKLTGVEPLVGQQLAEIAAAAPELRQRWGELYRRIFSGRTVASDDWYTVGGVPRYYAVSGTPVVMGGSNVGAAVHARDITEWQGEDRGDLQELAMTRLFAGDEPLPQSIRRALASLCDSDGWDAAIAWLIDPEGVLLHPEVIWTGALAQAEEFRDRVAELRFPHGRGLPGRCWASDQVISIADLMEETGMARGPIASLVGLHGVVAVPLSDAGRTVGVIELFTGPVRPLSDHHKASLRRAGISLAHLIARRRAEIERDDLLEIIERKGTEWAITFDSIELPIFLTTPEGAIVRVNRAARDFSGRRYRELTGLKLQEVQAGEPWNTLGDVVSAVHESGSGCTAKIYDPAADRTWDVSGSLSRTGPEEEEHLILILREITAVVRLQESVARGEQLAALGELVAGVAHQVRNPVFGISALLDGLDQRMVLDDPDTKEMMQAIRRWLERLSILMEELLQYGRAWRLELKEGDVAEVLLRAAEAIRPLAEREQVTLVLEIQEPLPILLDPERLVQAFENLITNAVQHSKAGGRIWITACRPWEQDDTVECVVRDEGRGFAPADLPSVFHPFFTRRRGGTGLGLSIVQRIIDEHGGTVLASNAPEGGGVMTATFPVYNQMTPEAEPGQ